MIITIFVASYIVCWGIGCVVRWIRKIKAGHWIGWLTWRVLKNCNKYLALLDNWLKSSGTVFFAVLLSPTAEISQKFQIVKLLVFNSLVSYCRFFCPLVKTHHSHAHSCMRETSQTLIFKLSPNLFNWKMEVTVSWRHLPPRQSRQPNHNLNLL